MRFSQSLSLLLLLGLGATWADPLAADMQDAEAEDFDPAMFEQLLLQMFSGDQQQLTAFMEQLSKGAFDEFAGSAGGGAFDMPDEEEDDDEEEEVTEGEDADPLDQDAGLENQDSDRNHQEQMAFARSSLDDEEEEEEVADEAEHRVEYNEEEGYFDDEEDRHQQLSGHDEL